MNTEPSVPPSKGMALLLTNETVCRTIATYRQDFDSIFYQIAIDITNEVNRDSVGPTVLALKHVQDIFHAFAAKGLLVVKNEVKTKTDK